jgi:hypothetical protein
LEKQKILSVEWIYIIGGIMKKFVLLTLIIYMLIATTGCKNYVHIANSGSQQGVQNTMNENEYLIIVKSFQDEISKYNSDLQPNQIAEICHSASEKLMEILLQKDSISSDLVSILGNKSDFYIKIKNDNTLNKQNCRIVEFGTKQSVMGGIIKLYVQSWNDDMSKVQEIYSAVIGENITEIIEYSIILQDNNYYFIIIDKLYGPESVYVRIDTKKYINSEWISYSELIERNIKGWNIESEELIILNSQKISFNNENDYEVRLSENMCEINVVDVNENIIDSLNIRFKDEKWQISSEKKEEKDVKWLSFSTSDFPDERELIKKYREKEIKDIEEGKMGSDTVVKIGIALADVNNDGKDEIIALISHNYYRSSQSNAVLGIYFISNGKVDRYVPLPSVFVDTGNLEKQNEIGFINNERNSWVDFIVNGKKYTWDGNIYN